MDKITIGKTEIPVKTQDITDCNILGVTVGTTGLKGEGKWDCKTYLALADEACTNIHANVEKNEEGDTKSVQLFLEGETELITLMCSLKFALDTLVERVKEDDPDFDLDNAYEARTKVFDLDITI